MYVILDVERKCVGV